MFIVVNIDTETLDPRKPDAGTNEKPEEQVPEEIRADILAEKEEETLN